MLTWKFLHILSMFTAVTLLFSYDIVFFRAASAGDVPAMRRIGQQAGRVTALGVVILILGIGFGIATAISGGFDLTAPWLISAYVIVGALMVIGGAVESPYMTRIASAAETSPPEAPSAELAALLASPRRQFFWVSVALYVAVIFVMVVKPFS